MLRLAVRLLTARVRRNRASSFVVVVVLATAGAAGTSAVLLRDAVSRPWERAFAATHGAHVRVNSFRGLDAGALARLPGVVESSGPVITTIYGTVALTAVPEDLRIDRPALVEGGWRAGAVVLERSFARGIGLGVGDRIDVGGTALEVSGIAVSVATPGYPAQVPGRAYTDPATAGGLSANGQRLTSVGLRLAHPSDEAAVARAASRDGGVATTASDLRAEALDRTRQFEVVLGSFAILLLGAAGFLFAVLLGARMRAERRQLVLFRLMGLTPAQLTALVAAEHAILAAAGGLLGAGAAVVGGGRLAEAAATALGSTSPRPGLSVLAVVGTVIVAAAGVTALAARRTAAPAPRPSAAAARALAAGLPAPAALAAKELSSSRGRAASTVLSVALATMAAVAALGMEATFRRGEPEPGLRALVYGLQALLALVALAGIVAVGLVSLRERRRELAVLRAVGFTARQLGASMVAGQSALAGAGALLGIPLGVGFFRLAYALSNGTSAGLVDAPPAHLAAVVPAAVLVAALVAALPASAVRRLPVAGALRPT